MTNMAEMAHRRGIETPREAETGTGDIDQTAMIGETETMDGRNMGDFRTRDLSHMTETGEITPLRETGMMELGLREIGAIERTEIETISPHGCRSSSRDRYTDRRLRDISRTRYDRREDNDGNAERDNRRDITIQKV